MPQRGRRDDGRRSTCCYGSGSASRCRWGWPRTASCWRTGATDREPAGMVAPAVGSLVRWRRASSITRRGRRCGHTLVWLLVAAACAIVLRRLRPLSPGAASLAASTVLAGGAVCRIADRSAPACGSAAADCRTSMPGADRRPGQLRHGDAAGRAHLRPVPQGGGSRSGFQLHPDRHPRAAFGTPAVARRAQRALLAARWSLSRRRAVRRRRSGQARSHCRCNSGGRDRPSRRGRSTRRRARGPREVLAARGRGVRRLSQRARAGTGHPGNHDYANRRGRRQPAAARAAGAGRGALRATPSSSFMTTGRRRSRKASGCLATARPASRSPGIRARTNPISIQLRADHAPNHVTLRAPGWIKELDLQPFEPQPIELPPPSRGVV